MKSMKNSPKALLILLLLVFTSTLFAQNDKSKRKSLPVVESKSIGDLSITIDYSAPSVNDREIWGNLVPYDKVWRTGANEATTISFSKDVKVNEHHVAAGTYSLFTKPDKTGEWLVILNSETDLWGSYKFDENKNVAQFEVKTREISDMYEKMTFTINEVGEVTFAWDHLSFSFLVISK